MNAYDASVIVDASRFIEETGFVALCNVASAAQKLLEEMKHEPVTITSPEAEDLQQRLNELAEVYEK